MTGGGSGVNFISETTCSKLGITKWEPRPFWLRMAETRSVHPIGLIQNLEFTLGGHAFIVSVVILLLDAPGSYPFLLDRPWLRTANIKQHWKKNMSSFQRGKTKVCVTTEARNPTPIDNNPLYAEGVHMLDGLTDNEMNSFLNEHPTIMPLFKIDVLSVGSGALRRHR